MNNRIHLLAFGLISFAPSVETQLIDLIPPTVVFTTPAVGATVGTGVVLRADASDAGAVVGVRFFVDEIEIPNQATVAPYWVAWDTRNVAEGLHLLTARAEDAAGNLGYATVPVIVDRTPPALTLTSPANLATVSNLVTISASAADNLGIDRVWFSANGVPLGEVATPPFEIVWDTSLLPDEPYTLQVGARDRAGSLNSVATTVTVFNGTTRIEQTDPAITYSGTWAHGNPGVREWSGGTAAI
ncbi:MAG: Ig-like domain-containing protein, partial [bacterium]